MCTDEQWMNVALLVSLKSCCVKVKVGAVVVYGGNEISRGYNRKYIDDDGECVFEKCERSLRGGCFYSIHAEMNAIINAIEKGFSKFDEVVIYTTLAPCLSCAKLIYRIGIREIRYVESYAKTEGISVEEGVKFLEDMGCNVKRICPDDGSLRR